MSQAAISIQQQKHDASAARDVKLEVELIRVSDVDRANEFYTRLGWRLDADDAVGNDFRVVQFTPPGSGCSITFARTTFASANDLASAMRRAAAAHDEHEERNGQHDANWPDWYAAYMAAEQQARSCRSEQVSACK
jgi:catechol 2,3-dioxygenase-like lactoylglutathione lyase family enzyme